MFLQTNRSLNGTWRDSAQETSTISDTLEGRLRAIEGELDRLKTQNQKLVTRIDQVDRKRRASTSHETSSPQINETNAMGLLGRRAFDVCDLLLYFFCLDFLTDLQLPLQVLATLRSSCALHLTNRRHLRSSSYSVSPPYPFNRVS